jgi:hypothetical protein
MLTHQDSRGGVAAPRRHSEAGDGSPDRKRFEEDIQTVARKLIFSCPKASGSDKQFLYDVARAESRFPMRGLERLARIAQQSTRPEHQEALAEVVRRWSSPGSEALDVARAFDVELKEQTEADVAQREFERFPNKANRERALDRLSAHLIAIRNAIRAVAASPIR